MFVKDSILKSSILATNRISRVGTTDFADNTDKEGIAVEGVFT